MDQGRQGPSNAGTLDKDRVATAMAIDVNRIEEVILLTISRPEALNAFAFSLIKELGAAIDHAGESNARVLIMTGEGDKAFCAGADIPELMNRPLRDQKRGAELGQTVFAKLDRLPIPSIALINGYAFGGGLELALACTFRLAYTKAKMGLPEIKLGLIPGYGGTQRLPRLIGESRAMEMILTGRSVSAAEALQIGLVNRIVDPPGLEAAIAFSREFSQYSLLALEFARSAVRRSGSTSLEEGLRIEQDLSTLAYQTQDAVEGMSAFRDKRKPVFRDR
jgi:enoyl-CoA hydratase